MTDKIIGIWLGYTEKIELGHDGISRFLKFIVRALLENSTVSIEIWSYSYNKEAVESFFGDDFNQYKSVGRLSFFSERILATAPEAYRLKKGEKNIGLIKGGVKKIKKTLFHQYFPDFIFNFFLFILLTFFTILKKIKKTKWTTFDQLAETANTQSRAQVFLIAHVSMANAISLRFPLVAMVYDLVSFEFVKSFLNSGYGLKNLLNDIYSLKNLSRMLVARSCVFVGISWYVMREQVLHYLPSLRMGRIDVLYIPTMINKKIVPISSEEIRNKFKINSKYVFYPTQIRSYKGVSDLLKAVANVNQYGYDLKVVLTGKNLDGDKEAALLAENSEISNLIVFASHVTDAELARLYLDAALVVCPSHYEGGIHQPLIESILWGCPAIASRLPQTEERLRFHEVDETLIPFFEPGDVAGISKLIRGVMQDRELYISKQRNILENLSNYTWADAAIKMLQIFDSAIIGQSR